MENKTDSGVPASSTKPYLDGLFVVDSDDRLVLSPESDIGKLPSWEWSDHDLKIVWMYNYRHDPRLLAEEMEKWPTRDLDALREDMRDAYMQFGEEDRQWQKDQQDSVDDR